MKKIVTFFIVISSMIFLSSCNPNSQINKIKSPISLFSKTVTVNTVKAANASAVITFAGSNAAKSTYIVKFTEDGVNYTTASENATSPFTISSGLVNGHTYSVIVSEKLANGTFVDAAPLSFTPIASFSISSATAGYQNVSLVFPNVTGASAYTVKYGTGSGSYTTTVTNYAKSPLLITGLTNGLTYYFMVTATNANNGAQDAQAPITAIPVAPSSAPTGLVVLSNTSSQSVLSWSQATGASSYNVKRSLTSGGPYQTISTLNALTYTDSSAIVGTTYYYIVTANNTGGESAATLEKNLKNISAFGFTTYGTTSSSQFNLAWAWPTGATYFDVSYRVGTGSYQIFQSGVTASSVIVTGLTAGTNYEFFVTAKNSNNGIKDITANVLGTPLASVSTLNVDATTNIETVALSWTQVTGATSYNVMYGTSSQNYTTTTANQAGLTLSLSLPYLVGGKYYFKIQANGVNSNSYSSEAIATVRAPRPGSLVLTGTFGNGATLTWPASTALGNITYHVYRATSSWGDYSKVICEAITVTTCYDTSMVVGTTYYYIVKATNSGGQSLFASNEVSGTAISNFYISKINFTTAGQLDVKWTSAGSIAVASYTLKYGTTSGNYTTNTITLISNNSTMYTVPGLAPGQTYYFLLQAISPNGVAVNAAFEVAGTPMAAPAPPNVTAVVTGAEVTLKLPIVDNKIAGATSYDVLYGTSSTSFPSIITNASVLSGAYISNLTYGTDYYFKIRAKNANGYIDGTSSTGPIRVLPPPPTRPTGLRVKAMTASTVDISWLPSSGDPSLKYDVYRSTTSGGTYNAATGKYEYTEKLADCRGIAQPTDLAILTVTCLNKAAPAGVTYYYVVNAYVGSGATLNTSANSVEVAARSIATFTIGAVTVAGDRALYVSWDDTLGASTYTLKYGTTSGVYTTTIAGLTTSSKVISSLDATKIYYFTVFAENTIGEGATLEASNPNRPGQPLAAFSIISFVPATATLLWNASTGASKYYIGKSTTSLLTTIGDYSVLTNTTAVSLVITPYMTPAKVFFRVRAANDYGTLLSTNEMSSNVWNFLGATTYNGLTDTTVTVNWAIPTDWVAPLEVIKYAIYTGAWNGVSGAGRICSSWSTTPTYITDPAATSGVVEGLSRATNYCLRVYAVGVSGEDGTNTSILTFKTLTVPPAPVVTLAAGFTSPSTVTTPTIHVTNIKGGDTIKLFSDNPMGSGCGNLSISQLVATGLSAIDMTPTLTPGTHYITAKAVNGSVSSLCSYSPSYVKYVVKHLPPTSLVLKNPVTNIGVTARPTITVFGVSPGDSVALYADSSCTTALTTKVVGSGTSVDIMPDNPLSSGAYTFYAARWPGADTEAKSDCSSASVSYQYRPCPSGFVPVPQQLASDQTMGVMEFCVMQYEAKGNLNGPTSQASGTPLVNMNGQQAKDACRTLSNSGGTTDLISNDEWMSIGRTIEVNGNNWTSGTAGTGRIYQGHSNDDGTGVIANDNSCPMTPGNTCNMAITGYWNTAIPPVWVVTWTAEQRRYHYLATDILIWDFAGNAGEIVEWGSPNTGATYIGPAAGLCNAIDVLELKNVSCLLQKEIAPLTLSYTSANGVGKFQGGTAQMAVRGGQYNYNSGTWDASGIYTATFNWGAGSATGFRCVWRPTF